MFIRFSFHWFWVLDTIVTLCKGDGGGLRMLESEQLALCDIAMWTQQTKSMCACRHQTTSSGRVVMACLFNVLTQTAVLTYLAYRLINAIYAIIYPFFIAKPRDLRELGGGKWAGKFFP